MPTEVQTDIKIRPIRDQILPTLWLVALAATREYQGEDRDLFSTLESLRKNYKTWSLEDKNTCFVCGCLKGRGRYRKMLDADLVRFEKAELFLLSYLADRLLVLVSGISGQKVIQERMFSAAEEALRCFLGMDLNGSTPLEVLHEDLYDRRYLRHEAPEALPKACPACGAERDLSFPFSSIAPARETIRRSSQTQEKVEGRLAYTLKHMRASWGSLEPFSQVRVRLDDGYMAEIYVRGSWHKIPNTNLMYMSEDDAAPPPVVSIENLFRDLEG